MQGEQCREDKEKRVESQKTLFSFLSPFSFETSEKRMVKESRKLLHQQEELQREQSSAFNVEEMQKEKRKAILKLERKLHKNEDELAKSMQKFYKEKDRI